MFNLVLLRHGNSLWNQKNLFTGWVDVDLSDQGREEAKRAGELLGSAGLMPDVLFTSVLKRAINTAHIALDQINRNWIDTKRSWRLNERHYGALQGLDKAETLEKFGPEQFQIWRRSYDTPPPEIADDAEYSQAHDERYAGLGSALPRTECLKDVLVRMLPYWHSEIAELNIPTGIPLHYKLDANLKPIVKGGEYLDPYAAAAGAAAVASQGKK
jgi:2,3-bisphosphoglycerate-dependent phosphoglycerate mutase